MNFLAPGWVLFCACGIMKRLMIIGCGGVGKSTLARELGKVLGLPVFHLDQMFWKAGWEIAEEADWEQRQVEVCAGERWVIDGNYGSTIDVRLAAADTVIYLDFARWRCLSGVVRRRFEYHGRVRPDMSEGCFERLDWAFLKWIWNYRRVNRPKVLEMLGALDGEKEVVMLRDRSEVRRFLGDVS